MKRFAMGSVTAAMLALSGLMIPNAAMAIQENTPPPTMTLEFRDAPLRAALEQLFANAKVDYSIDPSVQGYVNLKVTDIPFDNALKLMLRSSTVPLTYSIDNGVYIVKPRVRAEIDPEPLPVLPAQADVPQSHFHYDTIDLTYADPLDFSSLLKLKLLPVGTRAGYGSPGSIGIIGATAGDLGAGSSTGNGTSGGPPSAGNGNSGAGRSGGNRGPGAGRKP